MPESVNRRSQDITLLGGGEEEGEGVAGFELGGVGGGGGEGVGWGEVFWGD